MSANGFGFIVSFAYLLIIGIWTVPDDPMKLLDPHSFVTVIVGTTIIAIIAIPFAEIKMFFTMIRVVMRKEIEERPEIINAFVEMAPVARSDVSQLTGFTDRAQDPFFKDAVELLSQDVNARDLVTILSRRLEVQKERENSQAKMFKDLGKYPPAAGLMGTVMGMIALLGTLGQEGASSNIGPAMSVALGATLYGIILANIVILPVADNLMSRTQKSIAKRELIVEGIVLLRKKTSPTMVKELLLSHVSPGLRAQMENSNG